MPKNLMNFYKKNKNFRDYVDNYIRNKPITVKSALELSFVKDVAEYYEHLEKYGDQFTLF